MIRFALARFAASTSSSNSIKLSVGGKGGLNNGHLLAADSFFNAHGEFSITEFGRFDRNQVASKSFGHLLTERFGTEPARILSI